MLKSIHIKNFQSHKDTLLEFDEGTNAFIGPSDSGKTAIFRALKWVVENRPSGQDFHSWWKGDPSVTVELGDDTKVTRERAKSENIYRVNGAVLKAFGQRVPQEVQHALNLSPINFQWQMDSPFLLSQSSGEVARYLNSVVNLESIDLALANIERRLRNEKAEAGHATVAIESIQEQIKGYDWLSEVEKDLKVVEGLDKEVSRLVSDIMCLSNMLDSIGYNQRQIKGVEKVLQWSDQVNDLISDQQRMDALELEISKLDSLLDDIDAMEGELEKTTVLLKFEGELNRLIELLADVEGLTTDIEDLSEALYQVGALKDMMVVQESSLRQARTVYNANMPDICPLCNQPMPKKKSRRGN